MGHVGHGVTDGSECDPLSALLATTVQSLLGAAVTGTVLWQDSSI